MDGHQPADQKAFAVTERTRLRREHQKTRLDWQTAFEILDAGLMCHVGYNFEAFPYVTPTLYWRHGKTVYWHGSSASRMLRTLDSGVPACFTVTHFDGIVFARSGF